MPHDPLDPYDWTPVLPCESRDHGLDRHLTAAYVVVWHEHTTCCRHPIDRAAELMCSDCLDDATAEPWMCTKCLTYPLDSTTWIHAVERLESGEEP